MSTNERSGTQAFIAGKEYSIGDFFTFKNKTYIVAANKFEESCDGCDLYKKSICKDFKCELAYREDLQGVIAELVKLQK